VKWVCESVPLPRQIGEGDLEEGGQTERVETWCWSVIRRMREVGILED